MPAKLASGRARLTYDVLQALVDGPSTGVPRQAMAYKDMVLTPFVLKKLPRAAGSSTVKKVWEASEVSSKWEASAWAQKRARAEKRQLLSDFERFKVGKLASYL